MHARASGTLGILVKADRISAGRNSVMVHFICKNCTDAASGVVAADGQLMGD